MNPLRWSSCLWLWLMCTNVECLPKFHVSSRDQDNAVSDAVTVTMNFILDDTLKTENQDRVNAWLSWIAYKAMFDLQYFFGFTLHLSYTITHLEDQSHLKLTLKPNEEPYLQPEQAISTLADYYRDKKHSDIICLVTKKTLNDAYAVRNGYGYSDKRPICEDSLPILLVYAPGREGYSSHMLVSMIMDSIHLGGGEHVFNLPSDKHDKSERKF
uniref:Putative p32 protein n=1 Tax=Ixodes ricinus TaxID=34613 RepID=A0A0K8RG68_IXORI